MPAVHTCSNWKYSRLLQTCRRGNKHSTSPKATILEQGMTCKRNIRHKSRYKILSCSTVWKKGLSEIQNYFLQYFVNLEKNYMKGLEIKKKSCNIENFIKGDIFHQRVMQKKNFRRLILTLLSELELQKKIWYFKS